MQIYIYTYLHTYIHTKSGLTGTAGHRDCKNCFCGFHRTGWWHLLRLAWMCCDQACMNVLWSSLRECVVIKLAWMCMWSSLRECVVIKLVWMCCDQACVTVYVIKLVWMCCDQACVNVYVIKLARTGMWYIYMWSIFAWVYVWHLLRVQTVPDCRFSMLNKLFCQHRTV